MRRVSLGVWEVDVAQRGSSEWLLNIESESEGVSDSQVDRA